MSGLKNVQLSTPEYDDAVPSSSTKVKLTPFKVGDEKTLLIASESKDTKQMVNAMKTIIGNCVTGVEVEEMAPFDMEYLFLKLRSISVGETAEIGMSCGKCEAANKIEIDLTKVQVKKTAGHNNIVRINDNLGFEMKWPDMEDAADGANDVDGILTMVAKSIKTVYYGEETITVTDTEVPDLVELLQKLTTKQFQTVQGFFETAPKLSHNVAFTCHECGHENETVVEGLASFF